MKKVILATDFSDNANNAIDFAIQLFGTKDVNYALINTYMEPKAATNVVVSMNEMLRKESFAGLHTAEDQLRAKYPEIVVEIRSFYGSVATVINQLAIDEDFDFVVVGTKGITALESFVLGSNALNVVKNVQLPTLFVPDNSRFDDLKKMAFAADYEHLDHIELLNPLAQLAKDHNAELKIVNVQTGKDQPNYQQALEGLELHNVLEGVEHEFCTERNSDITSGIYDFVDRNGIQLLAMIARKHHLFDRIFHKSVTKEVTKLSHIPYLVLHE